METKCHGLSGNSLESQRSEWKESMIQTTDTILGYKNGRKEEWISTPTWNLKQEKKILKMNMETSVESARARFNLLHREKAAEVKKAKRRDK